MDFPIIGGVPRNNYGNPSKKQTNTHSNFTVNWDHGYKQ